MYALGFDIGGTKIEAIVKEQTGTTVKEKIREKVASSKDAFIKSIIDIAESMFKKVDEKILGLGISIAGSIDHKNGIVNISPNIPFLSKVNLKESLKGLKIPVYVDNDANCFALSEQYYGAGIGFKDFLGIIIGTGFGGGIIANGQIVRGRNNTAGEIGHMTLVQNGRQCGCGQKGCNEAYISGRAIETSYKEISGKQKLSADIFRLEDEHSRIVVEDFMQNITTALAGITNFLDPEAIVFGGGISNVPYLLERLEKDIPKKTLNSYVPRLLKAKLGDSSGVFGAAALVFDEIELNRCKP